MIYHLSWLPGVQTTPKLDFVHERRVAEQVAAAIDQRARECDETGICGDDDIGVTAQSPVRRAPTHRRRSALVWHTRHIGDTGAPTSCAGGHGRARSPGSTSPRVREGCVLIQRRLRRSAPRPRFPTRCHPTVTTVPPMGHAREETGTT